MHCLSSLIEDFWFLIWYIKAVLTLRQIGINYNTKYIIFRSQDTCGFHYSIPQKKMHRLFIKKNVHGRQKRKIFNVLFIPSKFFLVLSKNIPPSWRIIIIFSKISARGSPSRFAAVSYITGQDVLIYCLMCIHYKTICMIIVSSMSYDHHSV